jgi:thioredoxin-related protein
MSGLMFVFTCSSVSAQNRSINFETGTWKEVIEKAGSQHKMIFLDAYASWCGPCKLMAASVFTRDTVADFFNKNFVNAKFDMEKGEGGKLGQFYDVKAYPTYLFLDSEGNVVHRCCGSMSAAAFIQVATDAITPGRQFVSLRKRYFDGDRDQNFLYQYFDVISKTCTDVGFILDEYFAGQTENNLLSRINWLMINKFQNNQDSREFNFLIKNHLAFEQFTTADSIDTKIYSTFLRPAYRSTAAPDTMEWVNMKKRIKDARFGRGDELIFTIEMLKYATKQDWKAYIDNGLKFTEKYKSKDAVFLYEVSGRFAEYDKDPAHLKIALDWAERASKLDMRTEFQTNYAKVLFKNNKKPEAIAKMEESIRDAKGRGENTDAWDNVLKDWKTEK